MQKSGGFVAGGFRHSPHYMYQVAASSPFHSKFLSSVVAHRKILEARAIRLIATESAVRGGFVVRCLSRQIDRSLVSRSREISDLP